MNTSRDTQQRKIPAITAIIAILFFSAIVFGTASMLLAHIRTDADNDGDVGLHLDGTWETEGSTINDEHITISFFGDTFSSITKRTIFDATPEVLVDIAEFYRVYRGALVESRDIGDNNYLIYIHEDGMFSLYGNDIQFMYNNELPVWMPFYWDNDTIIINGDRFIRQ